MNNIKEIWKNGIQTILELSISLIFGVMVGVRLLFAWCLGRTKNRILRDAPPYCLNDPLLGRHKYIRVQDVKLHYVESGHQDNPLIVLIHGAPDFWFTWRRQIPDLSNDYWVVAVDLRGCGDSDTPYCRSDYNTHQAAHDIATLIKLLGGTPAHVMCAGSGGSIGWHLCYNYPQLISKMVLIHSPHPFVIRQHMQKSWKNYYRAWYLFFVRLPLLPEIAAHANDSLLVDYLFAEAIKSGAVTDDEVEAYKFTFSRRGDWTGTLHHLRQIDLRWIYDKEPVPDVITKPTLLIMADKDTLLPIDTAYRSAEYVERITVKSVSGQGHFAHINRSAQVNTIVGEFLRELPWRPLSPLEPAKPSSLVGRVMGASLAAVNSTVNKTSVAIEKTRSLPSGLLTYAQASFKVAESTLGLNDIY